jgi:hypothetical protein
VEVGNAQVVEFPFDGVSEGGCIGSMPGNAGEPPKPGRSSAMTS